MNINENNLNNIMVNYSLNKTIIELFEEQVKKTPNNYALVFWNKKLTYKELNEKSNAVARFLRDNGVGRDKIIGVLFEKSFEMIIAILGVLKSGGSYMILDPEYPQDRIKFMLENSGVSILLKQSKISLDFSFNKDIVDFDEVFLLEGEVNKNLENINKPYDLAYIIYTSGSTGMPKGVMVEHRNLINTVCFLHKIVNTDSRNRVIQFFNPGFTVCYQEIFVSLLFGEELHIIDQTTRDSIGSLLDYIEKMNINILFLPTSYLKVISNDKKILARIPDTIKHIITAGEQLVITDEFIKNLNTKDIKLHNNYGTSETNMATLYTIDDNIKCIPPIGKSIANTYVYILDKNLNDLPVGSEGEIFISGDSVGRGYINNPTLTLEKFIKNPFIKDKLMYRTGDTGKILPDGNIKLIGRIDFQIKVRGFRIEAGEVEYHILNYDSIREAVVVGKSGTSNSQYLCAFIVSLNKVNVNELKEYLNDKLPDYMVPTYIIQLEKLPKLPTGKINRKELSELDLDQINGFNQNNNEYIKSNNDSLIIAMIKDIIRNIGVTKFCYVDENKKLSDYAIDSLTFIKLISKVQDEFNIDFENKYLNINKFENIKSFISYIENKVHRLDKSK